MSAMSLWAAAGYVATFGVHVRDMLREIETADPEPGRGADKKKLALLLIEAAWRAAKLPPDLFTLVRPGFEWLIDALVRQFNTDPQDQLFQASPMSAHGEAADA